MTRHSLSNPASASTKGAEPVSHHLPFRTLVRAKGVSLVGARLIAIVRRYGCTPGKLMASLKAFVQLMHQHNVRATLPIPGIVLARHPDVAQYLHQSGMELAIHGWAHISFADMSLEEQVDSIRRAQAAFSSIGIPVQGFRSPYLSRNASLLEALRLTGIRYVSNQPILWTLPDLGAVPSGRRSLYLRAQTFYHPWSSEERTPTPRLRGSLVEIPVSLPDDEMLIDRLHFSDAQQIAEAWLLMLEDIYHREGLLTLQAHPERAPIYAPALAAVLQEARRKQPSIWIAPLSEIAAWWETSTTAPITAKPVAPHRWHLQVQGPPQLVWLLRGVVTETETCPWMGKYLVATMPEIEVCAAVRPFLGVPLQASERLVTFLREQGYIVERSNVPSQYGLYLHWEDLDPHREHHLLTHIENSEGPLIRLGKWPGGARSALAVTGDIDALTLGDYLWRILGR